MYKLMINILRYVHFSNFRLYYKIKDSSTTHIISKYTCILHHDKYILLTQFESIMHTIKN